MTQSRLPIPLPPAEIVRRAGELLEPGVPRTVLDAGMGTGRNSLYLARLGHIVTGISHDETEVIAARELAEQQGVADHCKFQQHDIRIPLPPGSFDVVLLNEVTHFFRKPTGNQILNSIRRRTVQGGLNVVSGYLVEPGTANATNTDRCFAPDELLDNYLAAGWTPLHYNENWLPIQHTSREIISSQATLIAERPWS